MKGTYVLKLRLKKDSRIRVGKLGVIDFKKGLYCYVGSAFGTSTNLDNRIKRYFKLNKERRGNLKWHIDYFLVSPNVEIVGVTTFDDRIECKVSRMLEGVSKASMAGFGCSDCNCKSHFYMFR
jgi:endonuclease-3